MRRSRTKPKELSKDSLRKSRSQSTFRSKETPLTPKRAEIQLQETPRPSWTRAQSTSRFGQLSHNSFFSRHSPHPNQLAYIQDLPGHHISTAKDNICKFSLPREPSPAPNYSIAMLGALPRTQAPVGDPRSLVEPRLTLSTQSNVWREELKELASRVAAFSKEAEVKKKEKEEAERLAQYSANTGRLIPGYQRTMTSRTPRTSHRSILWNKDLAPIVQDQELLILELLCQILQTDSLSAIQYWLISANPREKDLVLGLLQTAVAQLIPNPLMIMPEEKTMSTMSTKTLSTPKSALLGQGPTPQRSPKSSHHQLKAKPEHVPSCEKPEYIGNAEVLQFNESPENRKKKI
ncbi:protein TBATA [Gracilinanus agilis]|uniref:protein TBATA n=1 Tax=Gracilinanus agilis TaxID=191870 RepID=UPI001CFD9E95|nr:protein TBATA [Gracilinanus agilis]